MVRKNSSRRVGLRLLESVVLICGHCQGLLLHLRITFEKRQRWTLISIALRKKVDETCISHALVGR